MNPFFVLLIIVCSVLLLIVIFILLLTLAFYRVAFHPRRFTIQQTIDMENKNHFLNNIFGDNESFDSLEKENIELKMPDGYLIHGNFIPNGNNKKIVIISHGHTYTRYGSVKYMWIYRKLGYAALIYDNRGHGENKRVKCTMGYLEQHDLDIIIKYVYGRFGEDIYLGLQGESLGSTISCLALKNNPNIKFCVLDCGFIRLDQLLYELCVKYHLPLIVVKLVNLFCKQRNHFRLKDINLIPVLEKNKRTPIEVMVGDEDNLIPMHHSAEIFAYTNAFRMIHYYKGVDHAHSFERYPNEYFKNVETFLKDIESIQK